MATACASATQLQEQLSEQSATDPNLEGTDPSLEQLSEQSAARCVVSRGGAQDGASQEAHASLVSSMAALLIVVYKRPPATKVHEATAARGSSSRHEPCSQAGHGFRQAKLERRRQVRRERRWELGDERRAVAAAQNDTREYSERVSSERHAYALLSTITQHE